MPDALPGVTPVFGGGLAFGVSTNLQGSENSDCLFDSTMTAYTAGLHYLEPVSPIRHLEMLRTHRLLISIRSVLSFYDAKIL